MTLYQANTPLRFEIQAISPFRLQRSAKGQEAIPSTKVNPAHPSRPLGYLSPHPQSRGKSCAGPWFRRGTRASHMSWSHDRGRPRLRIESRPMGISSIPALPRRFVGGVISAGTSLRSHLLAPIDRQ